MKTKFSRKFLAIIIITITLAAAAFQAGLAQEGDPPEAESDLEESDVQEGDLQPSDIVVDINRVDSTNFPTVDIYFSVYGRSGNTIPNITYEDILLRENEVEIPDSDFRFNEIVDIETPLDIALLIDTSGSMFDTTIPPENTRLNIVTRAASRFIQNLRDGDKVGLIAFNEDVVKAQALTDETSLVVDALNQLATGGNTNLYDALYQGVEMVKNSEHKKAVIVITDGYDAALSEKTHEEVVQYAKDWNIPIYTIGFGEALIDPNGIVSKDSRLEEISSETGGFGAVYQAAGDVSSGLATVDSLLRTSYKISYTSTLPAENQTQQVSIEFTFQGNLYPDSSSFVPNPITLTFLQPALGEVLSIQAPIMVEAESTSKIAQVRILLDGQEIFSMVPARPDSYIFQAQWDLQNVTPGEHTLTAVATDTQGNPKSADLSVVVREPVIINILSPEDGGEYIVPPAIQVEVDTIRDLASATVFINGEEIAIFTENAFSVDWPKNYLGYGDFTLSVTALDVENHSGTREIQVKITADDDDGMTTTLLLAIFGGGGLLVALLLIIVPALAKKNRRKAAVPRMPDPRFAYPPSVGQPPAVQPVSPASSGLALQEITGENPGEVWPIGAYEVKFGRKKEDNDIPLKGETASRRMAIMQLTEKGLLLHPLKPENPVRVNGKPVHAQTTLKPGDEIAMGESTFKIIQSS